MFYAELHPEKLSAPLNGEAIIMYRDESHLILI